MVLPERNDAAHTPVLPLPGRPTPWGDAGQGTTSAAAGGYLPGGTVGQMQADLAHRLSRGVVDGTAPASSTERIVRLLSMAGGYGALLAGYGGIALLIFR